ncbi:hypothetical protein Hanom_Chr05g00393401 [Helianthus anomalus]
MAKIPDPDGCARNPTQIGRVYPMGMGSGMRLVLKNLHEYWSGTGLGDTRPDYPKTHTRLPELYTRSYTRIFNLYFYISLTLVY